jgi:tetratricopeptide (TPR) repeat protein
MSAIEEKQLGSEAWSKNDFNLAVVHFTNAIELNPEKELLLILYSNRSAAYLKLKQYIPALTDANKCLEIEKNFVKGYSRKGDALHALGRLNEALNVYNDGLKISSNDPTLLDKKTQTLNAIRKAASFNSESNTSTTSTTGLSGTFQKVSQYLRYFLLINILLYILPLGSWSYGGYSRSAISEITLCMIGIYLNHGIPKFTTHYLQKFITDSNMTKMFLSIILLFSKPYLLAIMPIFISELALLLPTFIQVIRIYLIIIKSFLYLYHSIIFISRMAEYSNPNSCIRSSIKTVNK